MTRDPIEVMARALCASAPCGQTYEETAKAALSALEAEGWRVVGPDLTDEMERAVWFAQYVHTGRRNPEIAADGEDHIADLANQLTDRKMADPEQRALNRAGFSAMLASAPKHGGEHGA